MPMTPTTHPVYSPRQTVLPSRTTPAVHSLRQGNSTRNARAVRRVHGLQNENMTALQRTVFKENEIDLDRELNARGLTRHDGRLGELPKLESTDNGMVLWPICSNVHWYLLTFNFGKNELLLYDPLYPYPSMKTLKKILRDALNRFNTLLPAREVPTLSGYGPKATTHKVEFGTECAPPNDPIHSVTIQGNESGTLMCCELQTAVNTLPACMARNGGSARTDGSEDPIRIARRQGFEKDCGRDWLRNDSPGSPRG
ncbi:unnamed protein product, partial [Mesorhabditis spiculigera]